MKRWVRGVCVGLVHNASTVLNQKHAWRHAETRGYKSIYFPIAPCGERAGMALVAELQRHQAHRTLEHAQEYVSSARIAALRQMGFSTSRLSEIYHLKPSECRMSRH